MYCDLPILRRCCFCFPLRPGLIAWGYLKMTADMVLIAMASVVISDSRSRRSRVATSFMTPGVLGSVVLSISLVDSIFDFLFLLATHTKNSKLLRSYLYYNMFLFVVSNITFFLIFGYMIQTFDDPIFTSLQWITGCLTVGFVNAVLQFYLILLIRSEVRKLDNDFRVTFENHESNAKCFLRNDEDTNDIIL